MNANAHPISGRLSPAQAFSRTAVLAMLMSGSFALRAIDPASLSWFPLRTSCGAATGLPCIFCGMTRALQHLLNGNVSEALYFNWLALPFTAIALAFAAKIAAELFLMRKMQLAFPSVRFTPRVAALGVACLLALWLLQVSLAVTLHKHELLNPNGILYKASHELHFGL